MAEVLALGAGSLEINSKLSCVRIFSQYQILVPGTFSISARRAAMSCSRSE